MNYTLNELYNITEIRLSKRRYKHTLRVIKEAKRLARQNNLDEKKIEIAALLHDSQKEMHIKLQLKYAKKIMKDVDKKYPEATWHAYAGAYYAERVLGIKDKDIINAIKNHTTGSVNMNLFEKVIMLADKIEKGRDYKGVEKIRKKSKKSVDEALLLFFKTVIKDGFTLHKETIKLMNKIKEERI